MLEDRYRSTKTVNSIIDFYKLIEKVWSLCGYKEIITHEFPTEEWAVYPCITAHVHRRTLSESPKKELRPRVRDTVRDPCNPEEFITILGQRFDYCVQFDMWALSNNEADELLNKFEDFMVTYTSFFSEYGVNRLFFYEQLEDKAMTEWREIVYKRSIQYYVCLERITLLRVAELNNVQVNIDVNF